MWRTKLLSRGGKCSVAAASKWDGCWMIELWAVCQEHLPLTDQIGEHTLVVCELMQDMEVRQGQQEPGTAPWQSKVCITKVNCYHAIKRNIAARQLTMGTIMHTQAAS